MLVILESGTTSYPKRRAHPTGPIGLSRLSTMYFIGLSRATSISTSAPRLPEPNMRGASFFAPWIAESQSIVAYNYARFNPPDSSACSARCRDPRQAPLRRLWRMLIQAHLGEKPRGARSHGVYAAGRSTRR